MSAGPTRRQLLAGAVGLSALSLAACTATRDNALVDRDTALRTEAADRERTLIAAYDTALLQAPAADRPRLAAVRAEHAEHLTALAPATASPTPPSAAPVGRAPDRAALRALERAATAAHADGAVVAGRALAGLLASLSASEASHAVALA